MNVLSLFDGMSCGQIALERCNFNISNYYSSEINKYSITVTQSNYPNTIQLGDVTSLREIPKIDLLLAGSPCQGFSYAGKGLNFEDPQSRLFFEFVRVLRTSKPKYWLLENVKMKKSHANVISAILDMRPIRINSSLVSAQHRDRLYWTNIPVFENLLDKGVNLIDILDKDEFQFIDKPITKITNHQSENGLICIGAITGRKWIEGKNRQRNYSQGERVYSIQGKCPSILSNGGGTAGKGNALISDGKYVRKLTVNEIEKLQTVPIDYTNYVSNPQRREMLGNGWTVDVISHLLKNIGQEPVKEQPVNRVRYLI